MEFIIGFFDFIFNDFIFYYFMLPLIFGVTIILVYQKENKSFIKPLIVFSISYYIARTMFWLL